MRTTFAGIEIGRRALQAQRQAIDVTGHNIANANTPGYSRQVARLTATNPYTVPTFNKPTWAGQMGTGVHTKEIVRMHDSFVQFQIHSELPNQGYWQQRERILDELEFSFLEPTDVGMRHAMDLFWQSLQSLANHPEASATRQMVVERAQVLAETLRNAYRQLEPMRRDLDTQVRAAVTEINALAEKIASLNRQIKSVFVSGDTPNDLMDARDQLLAELARIVDIQVVEQAHGFIAVSIGGINLVDGAERRRIAAVESGDDGFVHLTWENTNLEVRAHGGTLKALLEGRDVEIPYYMEELNHFARTLIAEFNRVHEEGYGLHEVFDPNNPSVNPPPPPAGRRFFKDHRDDPAYMTNAAAMISLTDEIIADPGNIAASRNGAEGDGANALLLAQLQQQRLFGNRQSTATEFFGRLVSGLGVKSERARAMVEHQEVMMGHLNRLRESVSGVSLDEEMTNLIVFQHGYAAASRLITTIDETIDIIINRMGLVGR